MPAASAKAMQMQNVSVARIQGDRSGAVSDALERFLTQVRVDQRPWFDVVQPMLGGRADQFAALRLASASSVEAVYSGRITQWETPSEHYTETRRRCAAYKSGGGIFKKCLRWTSYRVACLRRSAVFGADIEVISPMSGQIVHATTINATASDSGCGDSRASVESSAQLSQKAIETAIGKLDCEFAPCTVQRKLVLMNDTKGLIAEESKVRFSSAYDYVNKTKGQGLKTACSEWIQLAEVQMEDTIPLLFNVAACYEVNGDLDQAMDYLNRAKAKNVGINPEIETAINRIQETRGRDEVLKRQKEAARP